MSESVRVSKKKSEAAKEDKKSQSKKSNFSQSANSSIDRILFLQRTIGNQAVGRLIQSEAFQAKLRIGQPGDEFEQEADRVAEQVMSMSSSVQKKCLKCEDEAHRQPEKEKEEEETLQTKEAASSTSEVTPELESHISDLRGGGRPLPESVRAFFEPRFGYDFSHVRVHTDAEAAEAAWEVNAQAYTVGQDIVFGEGRYAPGTISGRRLLAHELTHTLQQNRSGHQSSGQKIQRTAASCPATWNTTVRDDHNRALGMLDTARGKLSSYDGTNPPEVKTALQKHFKASSTGFAGWVNLNLGFLRLMAPLADYDCEDTSSWWCGPDTLAKTFWCVPGVDIRVCQPLYFSQSDQERSATLIHEWVHKYGCNFDLGYSDNPDYPSQWTVTALLNADPFAQFVKDVQ